MKITEVDLTDFMLDQDNANQGSPRGQKMIEESLQEDGAARSVVIDEAGRVVAGNKTLEAAVSIGLQKAIVIETDGTELVVVKRKNWDLEDARGAARRYAYRDNRSSEVSLNWDPEQLKIDIERGIDFGGIFTEKEETDILVSGEGGDQKSDGSLLSLLDVSIGEPRHEVEQGQVWHIDNHVLICCNVLTEWQMWLPYLNGDDVMFAPYPGVFVPLSLKADEYKMVMVQPDPYIAGHILDRYEDVKGVGSISRE